MLPKIYQEKIEDTSCKEEKVALSKEFKILFIRALRKSIFKGLPAHLNHTFSNAYIIRKISLFLSNFRMSDLLILPSNNPFPYRFFVERLFTKMSKSNSYKLLTQHKLSKATLSKFNDNEIFSIFRNLNICLLSDPETLIAKKIEQLPSKIDVKITMNKIIRRYYENGAIIEPLILQRDYIRAFQTWIKNLPSIPSIALCFLLSNIKVLPSLKNLKNLTGLVLYYCKIEVIQDRDKLSIICLSIDGCFDLKDS